MCFLFHRTSPFSLREMVECFTQIAEDPDCRVVVVSGAGEVFTAGMRIMFPKCLQLSQVELSAAYQ